MLEKMAKKYISRLHNLPNIRYNKEQIHYQSINAFMISEKKLNDVNNKKELMATLVFSKIGWH